jgi:hypothetical protein
MRVRRLRQQGNPALQAAVKRKLITIYRAGEIAKLHVSEQEDAVRQWRNRSLRQSEGQRLAAWALRRELRRPKVDLDRVLSAIREAIVACDSS